MGCLVLAEINYCLGFPGVSMVENPPANAGDMDLIPGSGRSPGEGNGNPLEYSCLENSMDGGAWWATAIRLQSQTGLSDSTTINCYVYNG